MAGDTGADELLARMADTARETYIHERRMFESARSGMPSHYGDRGLGRWDGTAEKGARPDKYGRNFKPVWPEIVRFAVTNGADVSGLIRARFAFNTSRTPPEPPECKTPLALRFYEQRESDQTEKVRLRLESERMVTKVELTFRSRYVKNFGWTLDRVVRSIVDDDTLDLSPLFRVILAVEHGYPDLVESYFHLAVQQYHSIRRHLDGGPWAALVPQPVRDESDRLVQYVRRSAPR